MRRAKFTNGPNVFTVKWESRENGSLNVTVELGGPNAMRLTQGQVDDQCFRALLVLYDGAVTSVEHFQEEIEALHQAHARYREQVQNLRQALEGRDKVIEALGVSGVVRHKRLIRDERGVAQGVVETEVTVTQPHQEPIA